MRMLRRVTWCFVASALLLTACSSGGGGASASHRLSVPGDPTQSAAVGLSNIAADTPWVVYVGNPCLMSGPPIQPEGVRLVDPGGGLRIIDWGIRNRYAGDPYGSGVGAAPGTVAAVPGFAHQAVTSMCSDPANTELDVTVERIASAVTAVSHGFRVTFRDGHKSGSFVTRLTLTMCAARCPAG
jgi:hypothetical protein